MLANLNKKLNKLDRNYYSLRKRKGSTIKRLIVVLILLTVIIFLPIKFALDGIKEAKIATSALASAYQNQNFGQIQKGVSFIKNSLLKTDISLSFLFWLRIVPVLGGYYSDIKGLTSAGVESLTATEKLFSQLAPFEEQLGFLGKPISGENRVGQGIDILEKSLPHLDKLKGHFKKAKDKVKNIDTQKYPEDFRRIKVKKLVTTTKNIIMGIDAAVTSGREALEQAPKALGKPLVKTYLLLFQNDKEIRSTGGFITAFATLRINKGKIETGVSDDIYRLDERLLATCLSKICPLTPPPPIVKYLPEVSGKERSAWSMRDSNISPDVPTSARQFERMFKLLGQGLPFDGIIYIDSQVVEELIEVTGPIDVFGTKYSGEEDKRCNCPNVIYELESYAEIAAKGEQDRKAILGVLMQQILARALGSDTEKIPQLLETVARLANHKHIMFYMHDSQLQKALATLNWTGEIKDFDGDYLHINDSNFAGGKTNLYVEQKVTQEISVKEGEVRKKVTVEYKNPQAFGVWLNGINRDYVRFYVPRGSKLISSKGSEDPVTTIEDLGKTVFEAFIQVRPQNTRKLEIEYTVPYQASKEYKLLIQKQPGAKDFQYKIKLNGKGVADFKLDQDKEFKFDI